MRYSRIFITQPRLFYQQTGTQKARARLKQDSAKLNETKSTAGTRRQSLKNLPSNGSSHNRLKSQASETVWIQNGDWRLDACHPVGDEQVIPI